jgi:hypothetical protein
MRASSGLTKHAHVRDTDYLLAQVRRSGSARSLAGTQRAQTFLLLYEYCVCARAVAAA